MVRVNHENKILIQYLKNSREIMLNQSEHFSVAGHPVNLGAAREGLITNFFKKNLPEFIRYHSGELFDKNDSKSGQIDIILHPITAPKLNLFNTISMFPAETVLAAIEVKSNLTTGKDSALEKALVSCHKLKQLEITGRRRDSKIVDSERVPFVLFAYRGPKIETLKDYLRENKISSYRELPDLIIILDKDYYLVKNHNCLLAGQSIDSIYDTKEGDVPALLGIYKYLMMLIEYWSHNPKEHIMPTETYTSDVNRLFD